METKFFKAFVVGSSLPATIWSLTYLGIPSSQKKRNSLQYEKLAVALPAVFGLFNALIVSFPLGTVEPQSRLFLLGALFGLVFAYYGTHVVPIHYQVLGYRKQNWWMVYLFEAFFYAMVWGVVLHTLNRSMGLY